MSFGTRLLLYTLSLISHMCLCVHAQATLPDHDEGEAQSMIAAIPLMEQIVASLNDLHRRLDTTEDESRQTRTALSAIKQKLDADSQQLVQIEEENRNATSKLQEIADLQLKQATTSGTTDATLLSLFHNVSRGDRLKELKGKLDEIAVDIAEKKLSEAQFYSNMNTVFHEIQNSVSSTARNGDQQSQINTTIHHMWSSLQNLLINTANRERELLAKFDEIKQSSAVVSANVNDLLMREESTGNSTLRGAADIRVDLAALHAAVGEYQTVARNSATHIDEITEMVRADVARQKSLSDLLKNSSSTQRILGEKLLAEVDQLHISDKTILDNSNAVHAVQKIIKNLVAQVDERSRNTSIWQLSQAMSTVLRRMSQYQDDMGGVSEKIQRLLTRGNMQLEAFGNLTEQIMNVKEHVQAAHNNVTALIQNLSDKTSNISGLISFSPTPDLGTRNLPAPSCASLVGKPSGRYWIDPDGHAGSSRGFQAYCDMDTDNGGWTLVYSYQFAKYSSFGSASNAVTPRPTWPITWPTSHLVPSSTSVPASETNFGALSFPLWREIGSEFMVKSNIANWITCAEDGGSLVRKRPGSINCRIVKRVVTSCPAAVPDYLKWDSVGPYIGNSGGQIYFWDGSTSSIYPSHDACGRTSSSTRLSRVSNPHGNIYVR